MDNRFFEKPVINSPYEYPGRHWELDDDGQPILSSNDCYVTLDSIILNLLNSILMANNPASC